MSLLFKAHPPPPPPINILLNQMMLGIAISTPFGASMSGSRRGFGVSDNTGYIGPTSGSLTLSPFNMKTRTMENLNSVMLIE